MRFIDDMSCVGDVLVLAQESECKIAAFSCTTRQSLWRILTNHVEGIFTIDVYAGSLLSSCLAYYTLIYAKINKNKQIGQKPCAYVYFLALKCS